MPARSRLPQAAARRLRVPRPRAAALLAASHRSPHWRPRAMPPASAAAPSRCRPATPLRMRPCAIRRTTAAARCRCARGLVPCCRSPESPPPLRAHSRRAVLAPRRLLDGAHHARGQPTHVLCFLLGAGPHPFALQVDGAEEREPWREMEWSRPRNLGERDREIQAMFSSKKISRFSVTSNFWIHP